MGRKILDQTFWNKYFEVYDTLNKLIPYASTLRRFLDFVPNSKPRVLDLGCGTGNLMSVILTGKVDADMVGIDFSDYAIAYSKKKLSGFKNVKIFKHNLVKTLPFSDHEFDYVVMNNVLYTLDVTVRPKIMLEIYRVLKKGGRIAISSINENFSPSKIYLEHAKLSINSVGVIRTLLELFKYIIPTLKIFHYNAVIKRENKEGKYKFINRGEQQELLSKAGLKILVAEEKVYSGSAYFSVAEK